MNVIDPAQAGISVPRPRQLHDVQQSGANQRTNISSIHRRFSGPVALTCLAVGSEPDTSFARSVEPLVPIDSVKPNVPHHPRALLLRASAWMRGLSRNSL